MITALIPADVDLPGGASFGEDESQKKVDIVPLDLNLLSEGSRSGSWGGKLFVFLMTGVQRGWRGEWTPPSWSCCLTAQGSQAGRNLAGLTISRFWIFCISKGFNHGDQQSPLTINSVTCQAGFLERFHCKWHRRMTAFLLPAARLCSGQLSEVQ